MNFLSKLLGGAGSTVIDSVGKVIDNLTTSDKEKLDARIALSEIERKYNEALLTADAEFAKAQAESITAEEKSESWMARNWRPILMLTFTYIIAHTFVLAPLFSLKSVLIPDEMWTLLKLGMTGYIAGRTVEKVAPAIADAISSKKAE